MMKHNNATIFSRGERARTGFFALVRLIAMRNVRVRP